MKNRKYKGFTLIELLVVIAIIGILAAATLVLLGNVQQRAYNSNALSAMKSAQTVAAICDTDAYTLAVPAVTGGNPMCPGDTAADQKWPSLGDKTRTGWGYLTGVNFTPNTVPGTFSFKASSTNPGGTTYTCTANGCS